MKGNSVTLGTGLILYGGTRNYIYNWSPSTALDDSTVLHPVAKPTETTSYLLTVNDRSGCSFSIGYKVIVTFPDGIDQKPIKTNLSVILFPNPNNGQF